MKISSPGRKIYTFLNRKWFFDKVYNEYLVQGALDIGYKGSYKAIDRGVIEMLGPYGISYSVYTTSQGLSKMQSGYLYHYAFVMLAGVLLFVASIQLGAFIDLRLYAYFVVTTFLFFASES